MHLEKIKYSIAWLIVVNLLLSACNQSSNSARKKTIVKDIPDLRYIVVSKNCDRIIYSTNLNDIYSPWLLEGAFGTKPNNNTPLVLKSNLEVFPKSISCDCNTIALFELDKDQQKVQNMYLYDVKAKTLLNLTEKLNTKFSQAFLFSPTSNQFAYLDKDHNLQILGYNNYQYQKILNPTNIKFNDLIWSVKGKNIFLVDDDTGLWVFNIINRQFSQIWKAPKKTLSDNPRMLTPSIDDDNVLFFRSDHESNVMQIYKYDARNGVHLFLSSKYGIRLFETPQKVDPFYYKTLKDGFVTLSKYTKGNTFDLLPSKGTMIGYYPGKRNILIYADHQHPFSVYQRKHSKLTNLIRGIDDNMPEPVVIKNSYGMDNLIYSPLPKSNNWVVYLHGGPHQQMRRKYDRYISHLVKSGIGIIVLNYPGSEGIGKKYEMRDEPNLFKIELESIRKDIDQIKLRYKEINKFSMIGVSYSSLLIHAYSLLDNNVIRLIDYSGIGSLPGRKNIPILYIFGTNDFALNDIERSRMIEQDSINNNGFIFRVGGEGHIIAHRKSTQEALDEIVKFIK